MSDKPKLHQSTASVIVNKSPLHAWFRRFGGAEEEVTEATDRGNLCHTLLLGGGKDIVIVDADAWRTNTAKAQRDEARQAGKLPILKHKFEESQLMALQVKDALAAKGISFDSGKCEFPIEWTSEGVECAGRIDHLIVGTNHAQITDLKFVADASMRSCINSFYSYGYDVQHAAYVEAVEKNYPAVTGRVTFTFVFVEAEPPHPIRIMPLAGSMKRLGEWRWIRAREIWRSCLETYGTETPWPCWDDDGLPAEAPAWALDREKIEDLVTEGGNL